MSFLSGLFKSQSRQGQQVYSGLQLQSSAYGKSISVVYGTTRIAPNLIWTGDFVQIPQSQSVGGKGGVLGGGGGKGGAGSQYNYQCAVAMALCEGPIEGIGNVYVDKNIVTLASLGMTLFTGEPGQAPWSYLVQQSSPITETHTVPASAPYTVTVNSANIFLEDDGVTNSTNTTYTRANSSTPAANQYVVTLDGLNEVVYTFNASNAGAEITISTGGLGGAVKKTATTIPSSSPYTVSIATPTVGFGDHGVVGTGIPLTEVTGTPGSGQYSISDGLYTFNSAQAGATVTIVYFTTLNNQGLGYSGIAYVAASAYQLGSSAQLPNHNFEVQGVYANSVTGDIEISEDYSIPSGGSTYYITSQAATYVSNVSVVDQNGIGYNQVPSNPGAFQYAITGGTYWFSAANAYSVVTITYIASSIPDADPSLVVQDFLTNTQYGLGFPVDRLGSFSTYQAYCIANGLLISPAYDSQSAMSQFLTDIATATNSNWVWSNGQLTLVPYGDQTVTGNGYTYTAPSSPLYSLGDSSFQKHNQAVTDTSSTNDDPVIMTRSRPSDAYNSIKIECLDRGNSYNPVTVQAKDLALISQYGLRQQTTGQFHMFCNVAAGQLSATLQLQRLYTRNTYAFTLDNRYIVLDPMDIIAISDSYLGISNQWVRIIEITENDDDTLSIVAEEYLGGTGSAPTYTFQSGLGFNPKYNDTPGNVNVPMMFEPPEGLGGGLEIWIAASGMNTSFWGGCQVWVSQDGTNYTQAGQITGAARQGMLASALPSITPAPVGLTVDNTNTLIANLSESNGQLLTASQSDMLSLNTLCIVDGELISYTNSTLTGTNQYSLTGLGRGAYGSTIGAHNLSAPFARLDSAIFKFSYPVNYIGETIQFKFLSFNVYGGGLQGLADVNSYYYTVQGSALTSDPANVTGFATAYIAGLTQLTWNSVTDSRQLVYEIRLGSSWAGGQVINRTPLTQSPILGDGTYWIAALYIVPNGGPYVYSQTPASLVVTGSQITTNVIASFDEAATNWSGTFVNTSASVGNFPDELALVGSGDITQCPDITMVPDIVYYGGVVSSGSYEVPASHRINVGRVATCNVIIKIGADLGYSLNASDVTKIADITTVTDMLGISLGARVTVTPQIRLSQDGTTWGAWQNWIPGSYTAMAYDFQVLLATSDPTVVGVLSDFVVEVDVPTLTLSGSLTTATGGTAVPYSSTFNGGPDGAANPNLQVTVIGGSAGDTVLISAASTSGFTVQVVNGGVGVARTVNYVAQGY